ncbi:MAG: dihydrodipicolinate synthase family protein [Anaerolineae bacterium]
MNGLKLRGVIVPLITPFHKGGSVNVTVLKELVDFLIDAGVHGLFAAGTTGEGPLLTPVERRMVAETVVRQAGGRVPVIIQAGTPVTAESIEQVRRAQVCGADAAALLCPYYYRLDDEALIEHFCAVAESVPDYPLYLYNIPPLTGNNISPAVTAAVAQRCPNVVGEKDSSGDLNQVIAKLHTRNGDFEVLIGSDGLILSSLVAGVQGSVSGNANVFPELFVTLFNAFWQGDLAAARAAQEKIHSVRSVLKDGADLSLFKGLLAYRGMPAGPVRPPLRTAGPEMIAECHTKLIAQGIDLA